MTVKKCTYSSEHTYVPQFCGGLFALFCFHEAIVDPSSSCFLAGRKSCISLLTDCGRCEFLRATEVISGTWEEAKCSKNCSYEVAQNCKPESFSVLGQIQTLHASHPSEAKCAVETFLHS